MSVAGKQESKQKNMQGKEPTGYPSIDKPWRKYYSKEALQEKLPVGSMYDYVFQKNKECLNDIALVYYGEKIRYKRLFKEIDRCASGFWHLGIRTGDIVSIQSISILQLVIVIYALNKIGAYHC